jgi:hypothetical protein
MLTFKGQVNGVVLNQEQLTEWGFNQGSERVELFSLGINSIEVNTFQGYASLRILYLSDNPLVSLQAGTFNGLTNLETLFFIIYPASLSRNGRI